MNTVLLLINNQSRIQSGDCSGKPRYSERLIEVYSLFYYLDMADGFDAKKSKIGEKALVAFIEADTVASLDSVQDNNLHDILGARN